VSELDAALLVRRTRLLLRSYPKAYRAHRGEEILGTLLETTRPGRGWPPAREVASVIGGGLRARRAANLSQGLGASLRHVGILAAAVILADVPAFLLFMLGRHIAAPSGPYDFRHVEPLLAVGSLLVVTALAATWCGCRWPVAVAAGAVAAVVAAIDCHLVVGGYAITLIAEMGMPTALALVVLLPLTKRAQRPPASLLWLPCLPVAVLFVEGLAATWSPARYDMLPIPMTPRMELLLSPYDTYLSLVPVLVAICWLVTDVRPLAALALQSLLARVISIAFDTYPGESRTQMMIVIGLVLLALTGGLVWLLRHRARTAPPTIG